MEELRPIETEELGEILALHDKWMASEGKEGKRAEFHKLIFRGALPNMEGVLFHSCNFENIENSKLCLNDCEFHYCNFHNTIRTMNLYMQGSTFKNCQFWQNNVHVLDLGECSLVNTHIADCFVSILKIEKATVKNTSFSNCSFGTVRFSESTLAYMSIISCSINSLTPVKTKMDVCRIERCLIDEFHSDGAALDNCVITDSRIYAMIKRTTITNTIIQEVLFGHNSYFSDSDIDSCSLRSSFQQCVFRRCRITNTSFGWANLRSSQFLESTVERCSFRDAALYRAYVSPRTKLIHVELPSPQEVLSMDWNFLPPRLVKKLMKYDSMSHPDPEMFGEWARNSTRCPYQAASVHVQRAASFEQNPGLYEPGYVKSIYKLMDEVVSVHSPDWEPPSDMKKRD